MTTVFLSGSRAVSRLPQEVIMRLDNIVQNGFSVVTGDANGADKAFQKYLANHEYKDVKIFYVGSAPRNNVGNWNTEQVEVPSGLKGRDFYTQKDKFMAGVADYGMVLWDGKSSGSAQNMIWLEESGKCCLVFYAPIKKFFKLSNRQDFLKLMDMINPADLKEIQRKVILGPLSVPSNQGLLDF